jgi:hypothetical protein
MRQFKRNTFSFPHFLPRSSGNNHFHCCLSRPRATVVGSRFTECEPSFLQSSCEHRPNRSAPNHVREEQAGPEVSGIHSLHTGEYCSWPAHSWSHSRHSVIYWRLVRETSTCSGPSSSEYINILVIYILKTTDPLSVEQS